MTDQLHEQAPEDAGADPWEAWLRYQERKCERWPSIIEHGIALLVMLGIYSVLLPVILTVFAILLLWMGWGDIRGWIS